MNFPELVQNKLKDLNIELPQYSDESSDDTSEPLEDFLRNIKINKGLYSLFYPEYLEQKDVIGKFYIEQGQDNFQARFKNLKRCDENLRGKIEKYETKSDAFKILHTNTIDYLDSLEKKVYPLIEQCDEDEKIFSVFQKIFNRKFLKVLSGLYRGLLLSEKQQPYIDYLDKINDYLKRIGIYTEGVEEGNPYDPKWHDYVQDSFRDTDKKEEDDKIYQIRQYPYLFDDEHILSRAQVCVCIYQGKTIK